MKHFLFIAIAHPGAQTMPYIKDNSPLMETKQTGYNAAERVTAYGNTVRILYEQVVAPSAPSPANLTRNKVVADEDLSVVVDAVLV